MLLCTCPQAHPRPPVPQTRSARGEIPCRVPRNRVPRPSAPTQPRPVWQCVVPWRGVAAWAEHAAGARGTRRQSAIAQRPWAAHGHKMEDGSRVATSVRQLRHDQMEQGPTEAHAGRSTFLLSFGGARGGYYRVADGTGPVPTDTQFPCRTLVACLDGSGHGGTEGSKPGNAEREGQSHGSCIRA